jgi:hypothetical protein
MASLFYGYGERWDRCELAIAMYHCMYQHSYHLIHAIVLLLSNYITITITIVIL